VYDKEVPLAPRVPEAPRLQQLIQACLQLDPKKRITAQQAVQLTLDVCDLSNQMRELCTLPHIFN